MKLTLDIKGKKGPFHLRKLGLDEVMEYFAASGSQSERMLALVQMTLVNGTGKPVYTERQRKRMEADLGGVRILALAQQAAQLNEFDALTGLGVAVEDAEKN